jgi:hypothetical protein
VPGSLTWPGNKSWRTGPMPNISLSLTEYT